MDFVHTVKSLAVPLSDKVALSITYVVLHYPLKLGKTAFEVGHLLGSVADLEESYFSLALDVFLKNLNQQLRDQVFDFVFILAANV